MAQYTWTVKIGTAPSVYTMTDVQGISLFAGIANVTDQLRAGGCTITGRVPSSQPTIAVGDRIQVEGGPSDGATQYFVYRVKDFEIEYGVVPAEDRWTLTGEDVFAFLGRATVNDSWPAGYRTDQAANVVAAAASASVHAGTTGVSTVSAQTITNANALNELTKLVNTEQAGVYSYSTNTVWWLGRGWQNAAVSAYYADDGSTSGLLPTMKYDRLQFAGIADNYADMVEVSPAGLSTQTSGTGNYSYSIDSYDQTTAQAANLAAFVEGELDVQNSVPYVMSAFAEQQATDDLLSQVGLYRKMQVKFRSNTYTVFTLGYQVTASPEMTRVSFNLASAEAFAYLTLNDTVLGRLDNNKLGF